MRQPLLVNLCHLGRLAEAELGLAEVRTLASKLGNQLDLLRVDWLQGKIAAGLGRTNEAITSLGRVRAEFMAQENAYDTALVTLELAQIFASMGRTAEVKELARKSAPIFEAQGVHREAQQALALFRRAAEEERISAELVRGAFTYLYRSRYDSRIRYEAGREHRGDFRERHARSLGSPHLGSHTLRGRIILHAVGPETRVIRWAAFYRLRSARRWARHCSHYRAGAWPESQAVRWWVASSPVSQCTARRWARHCNQYRAKARPAPLVVCSPPGTWMTPAMQKPRTAPRPAQRRTAEPW